MEPLSGGSSAINFYAWIKPPASDIDAFEKLGNPGWNWKDYEAYSKKAETWEFVSFYSVDQLLIIFLTAVSIHHVWK